MSWQLKLSNWLSGGALDRSQKQAKFTQTKLKQQEETINNLKTQLQQAQTDIERFQAQLQISEGFQIELGETQIKLQSATAQAESCQQELRNSREQLKTIEAKYQQLQVELSDTPDWFQQARVPIQVTGIEKLLPKTEFDTLWGFGLGSPKAKTTLEGGSVIIKGWVLGRKSTVSKVQIAYQERVILDAITGQARPAITQQYPDIPQAGNSGFECCLAVVGMPSEIKLTVQVVLEDETTVPLCAIGLQR